MKIVINLALLVIVALLIWMLISGIREPIKFQKEREIRTDAVESKLRKLRTLQETYRDVTGMYAGSFDELFKVARDGQIMQIAVYGNEDDPDLNPDEIRRDTSYISVAEHLKSINSGINIDSLNQLKYVPFNDEGEIFEIYADTITYQSTPRVPVVQIGTVEANYMGKYADAKYKRYDDTYDPSRFINFGDRESPNLSGNWE